MDNKMPRAPVNIFIMYYPQAMQSSISFPLEIFQVANILATKKTPPSTANTKPLHIHHLNCYQQTQQVVSNGLSEHLNLDHTSPLKQCQLSADLILLPAIWRNPLRVIKQCPELIAWLVEQQQKNAYICAVGSASFLLAEAGLLTGRAATTHWYYLSLFSKRYPHIRTMKNHLITQSANIFCAASINALIDSCIYFCELFFNTEISQQLSGQFSPEIRRSVSSQIYDDELPSTSHDEVVAGIQQQLRMDYRTTPSLQQLARQHTMTSRNLSRRFKNATGLSIFNYLQKYRVSIAKELLSNSNLSISDIAQELGFSDTSHLIRHFKKHSHMTPRQYRYQSKSKIFFDNQ